LTLRAQTIHPLFSKIPAVWPDRPLRAIISESTSMKAIIAAAIAAMALASIATVADAHPHKVCARHHHHLVCHWVK
jgi:hypothetical protein